MSRIVIFGGYGVFGGHVARELDDRGYDLTIAGRNGERAGRFAQDLGTRHRGIAADVTSLRDTRKALEGAAVAIHCAGPFAAKNSAVLESCLDAGCHYVDLADDRDYCSRVRELGPKFAAKKLLAVFGCSSLPGISGALAQKAAANSTSRPTRTRVTLFIGNHNAKGFAAIASLVSGLGRPIRVPQGIIRGFRGREVVPLPPPFGDRAVFNFNSPDYDLLADLVGTESVAVKAGFELRLVTYAFALMARLPVRFGPRTAQLCDWGGGLVSGFGSSGGAVMTELFYADGSTSRATALARKNGQRMAALPAVFAVEALANGRNLPNGAMAVYDFIGGGRLLDRITAAGYEVITAKIDSKRREQSPSISVGNMSQWDNG